MRAKVLRSGGVEPPSPHPRACALSCPSLAIYGPGSCGISALIILVLRAAASFSHPSRRGLRYAPASIMPLAALFPCFLHFGAAQPMGVRYSHAGEAARGLLQRREGCIAPREDARAHPPDAPRRRTRGGARGQRPARTVEDLQGLRRHTPRPEPRLGPRGRLLRPFALPRSPAAGWFLCTD